MKKIISSILVFAMLLTMVPVVLASDTNDLHLGGTTITGNVGEEIAVPVYLTGANDTNVTVPSGITFRVSMPTGLTATVEAGAMAVDGYVTVQAAKSRINVFYDGASFTAEPTKPLFTIKYTASAAGDYDLTFSAVDFDTLTVNAVGATLSVTEAAAEPVLQSIAVDPTAITVPYANQTDDASILAYVKSQINTVTATYDIGEPSVVTDYEVTVSGSVATVAYGGKEATIALTMEEAPVVSTTNRLHLGAETISGDVGEEIAVPVYLTGANNTELTVPSGITFRVSMPTGLTATVEAGTMAVDGYVTVQAAKSRINVFYDGASFTAKPAEPLFTIKYTASAAGDYDLTFSAVDFDTLSVEAVGATLTAIGASDPVKSLVVEPATLSVPYAEQGDVAAYIKSKITSATYFVDETGTDVLADITVDANGLVTYEDTSFQIEVTLAPAPVITGITVSGVEAITVGYGEEADTVIAEALAGATVTVAYDSIPAATVTDYTTNYDGTNVVIGYAGTDKTATIPVTVITATGLELTPASVVVPYAGDVVEYVKANVDVKVVLSDDTKVAPLGEITYTLNETTVTVEADGLSADVAFTMGANPDEIVSIEADVAEVAVPYANKDAVEAYIAANVVITATKNVGTEVVGITAENVVAAEGVATITVAGVSTTVNYTVEEITGIVVTPETLDVPYTVEDIAAFVAESIDVYYVYSADTANSEVAAEDVEITVEGEVATIKVGEYEAVEVALNIEPTPDYIEENVTETENGDSVYALPGFRVVVINMNVDGVPSVDGKPALKIADKKFAVVTDAVAPVITVDTEATAEIVAWGRLHRDDMVTALDALIAINAADGVIAAELSADVNTYIKADLDGDYEITAADALKINNISLGKN